jgi:hypothetical protein
MSRPTSNPELCLRAAGDNPTDLAICGLLADGPLPTAEIAGPLGISARTVRYRLARLQDSGDVCRDEMGRHWLAATSLPPSSGLAATSLPPSSGLAATSLPPSSGHPEPALATDHNAGPGEALPPATPAGSGAAWPWLAGLAGLAVIALVWWASRANSAPAARTTPQSGPQTMTTSNPAWSVGGAAGWTLGQALAGSYGPAASEVVHERRGGFD